RNPAQCISGPRIYIDYSAGSTGLYARRLKALCTGKTDLRGWRLQVGYRYLSGRPARQEVFWKRISGGMGRYLFRFFQYRKYNRMDDNEKRRKQFRRRIAFCPGSLWKTGKRDAAYHEKFNY